MKKIISTGVCLFLYYFALGQNVYDVTKIPASLSKDAVAVVRNEEQFFDFKNLGTGQLVYKIAITILSPGGDDFAEMAEVYDKFSSISNIKAAIFDGTGKKIRDYKSSEIKDQSLISSYSMFEDNRIKLLKFYHNTYPYTIEYSYTQDFKGILSIPSWRSIKGYAIATEKTIYTVQRDQSLSLKYLTSKNLKTDSTKIGDKVQFKWSATNVPAQVAEPYSAGLDQVIDWVKVSPNKFEYDNTTGNFDTWKNFGAWINKLNENANILPPATKAKIQELVTSAKSPKEKVSILYNYLQQHTRYVSVQLGIGGFKPILAEKVAAVNYGDCKALSNYMKALLNEVGIKSNLIVIGNGMPSLTTAYSSMGQANHMILCVPLANETIFLECTSQEYPMGFIGYDNADRNVLMVTDEGGKIVRTPTYGATENYQNRKINVNLNSEGIADIAIKSTYGTAQFEDNLHTLLLDAVEQRKMVIENNKIPGADVISFKFEQADKTLPVMTEEISYKTTQLLSKGGEKAFLTINLINRKESVPAKVENRQTHFSVTYSYQDEDEISYTLPKNYTIEFLPKDINITSEFGSFTASFATKENTIVYKRKQTMNAKTFPPEKYNDFIDFNKKIYQADKLKAVLSKLP